MADTLETVRRQLAECKNKNGLIYRLLLAELSAIIESGISDRN